MKKLLKMIKEDNGIRVQSDSTDGRPLPNAFYLAHDKSLSNGIWWYDLKNKAFSYTKNSLLHPMSTDNDNFIRGRIINKSGLSYNLIYTGGDRVPMDLLRAIDYLLATRGINVDADVDEQGYSLGESVKEKVYA